MMFMFVLTVENGLVNISSTILDHVDVVMVTTFGSMSSSGLCSYGFESEVHLLQTCAD